VLGPLDFLYCPSRDAAADRDFWTDRLGATPVFAVERFETRVACVEPVTGGPAVLFAEHLHGDRPVLLHRVDDLAAAVAELGRRGVGVGEAFEFPYGEGAEIELPGPQRVAVYSRTRADRGESLRGRRDF
jgi:catechol 2,3-dioxygenase-like lactoylglutathione lyase family enzyme